MNPPGGSRSGWEESRDTTGKPLLHTNNKYIGVVHTQIHCVLTNVSQSFPKMYCLKLQCGIHLLMALHYSKYSNFIKHFLCLFQMRLWLFFKLYLIFWHISSTLAPFLSISLPRSSTESFIRLCCWILHWHLYQHCICFVVNNAEKRPSHTPPN